MTGNSTSVVCSIHGSSLKRAECNECNASYMRVYQRVQRARAPATALFERARGRARRRNDRFTIRRQDVFVPNRCPVLGLPLQTQGQRSDRSPSLDKIEPALGYVPGNVRVISDRANRLKGARDLEVIQHKSIYGPVHLRKDYELVRRYMDREALLAGVRSRAACDTPRSSDWRSVEAFLEVNLREGDRVFRHLSR